MSDEIRELPEPDVSPDNPVSEHWVWAGYHRPPMPRVFVDHMTTNWAPVDPSAQVHPAVNNFAERREALGRHFSDATLVVPTGNPKVRANDTDYRFRAGTDFYYLTGCQEPDAVLVISPGAAGSRSTQIGRAHV